MKSCPRASLSGLLQAAGALLVLFTVTGFLGRLGWLLELTAHFRVQYLAGLAGLALFSAVTRRWIAGAVFAVFAAVNLFAVLATQSGAMPPARENSPRLRVLLLNVHTSNTNHAAVLKLVRDEAPDVAVLLEVDDAWWRGLTALSIVYPNQVAVPREDNFGIALFSRLPLRDSRILELGEAGLPSVEAQVGLGDTVVTILGTHPLPPSGRMQAHLRNEQLATVGHHLRELAGHRLLVGDLNATPWSPEFQRLLAVSGLRDSRPGFGLQATWPSWFPPLLIPLDHGLVSPGLAVLGRRVGPGVGSDHRPVWLEIGLAR